MVVIKRCMRIRKDLCLTAIFFCGTFESCNVTRDLYRFPASEPPSSICRYPVHTMAQNEGFFDAFLSIQKMFLSKLFVARVKDMHVLLHDPVTRAASHTAHRDRILSLQEALGDAKRVKEEIFRLEQTLTRAVGQLQSLESPIGSLPNELLRDILMMSSNESASRTPEDIERLAMVCTHWRMVIFNERHLFSKADWNNWSPSKIGLWCSRANVYPLSINLLPATTSMFLQENSRKTIRNHKLSSLFVDTVTNPALNCTHLTLDLTEALGEHIKKFFSSEFPKLRHIHCSLNCEVHHWVKPPIEVYHISAPELRRIQAEGMVLCPRGSSHALSSVDLNFPPGPGYDVGMEESNLAKLVQLPMLEDVILQNESIAILQLQKTYDILAMAPRIEIGVDGGMSEVVRHFEGVTFPAANELVLSLRRGDKYFGRYLEEDSVVYEFLAAVVSGVEFLAIADTDITSNRPSLFHL